MGARWNSEDVKEEEDGKLLRAGGGLLIIVSTSWFHIYNVYTCYDSAAIQNDIKTPGISYRETSGMK